MPTFCNLVQLEIFFDLYDGLPGPVLLMDLLDSSPKLEALSLPKSIFYENETKLPTFCNLVQLVIGLNPHDGLVLLMDLLDISPKLEALLFPEGMHLLSAGMSFDLDDELITARFNPNKYQNAYSVASNVSI